MTARLHGHCLQSLFFTGAVFPLLESVLSYPVPYAGEPFQIRIQAAAPLSSAQQGKAAAVASKPATFADEAMTFYRDENDSFGSGTLESLFACLSEDNVISLMGYADSLHVSKRDRLTAVAISTQGAALREEGSDYWVHVVSLVWYVLMRRAKIHPLRIDRIVRLQIACKPRWRWFIRLSGSKCSFRLCLLRYCHMCVPLCRSSWACQRTRCRKCWSFRRKRSGKVTMYLCATYRLQLMSGVLTACYRGPRSRYSHCLHRSAVRAVRALLNYEPMLLL